MLAVTEEERFVEVLAAVSVGGLRHFEVVTCLVVYKNVFTNQVWVPLKYHLEWDVGFGLRIHDFRTQGLERFAAWVCCGLEM